MSVLQDDNVKLRVIELANNGYNKQEVANIVGIPRQTISDFLNMNTYGVWWEDQGSMATLPKKNKLHAKILVVDIESSPMLLWGYGLFNQNFSPEMIEKDWNLLTYCAKFVGEDKIYYGDIDPRGGKTEYDILKEVWELFDQADILLGQNSNSFDIKKLNAKFFEHKIKPYSSFKKIDTLQIAKKSFKFSSNRLGYMTEKFNDDYKKIKHEKFPGISLFVECTRGNEDAWDCIKEYNLFDVLATEELYLKMQPWAAEHPVMTLYQDGYETTCSCGSTEFSKSGYAYTNVSKFTKYACDNCGKEYRDRINLVTKDARAKIWSNVV